jgi:aspartate racemase
LLNGAAERLASAGAELIVAGCTEVSLVLTSDNSPFTVIDPLEIIARVAVARARPDVDGERAQPESFETSLSTEA